jgi:hypothetical protein
MKIEAWTLNRVQGDGRASHFEQSAPNTVSSELGEETRLEPCIDFGGRASEYAVGGLEWLLWHKCLMNGSKP